MILITTETQFLAEKTFYYFYRAKQNDLNEDRPIRAYERKNVGLGRYDSSV